MSNASVQARTDPEALIGQIADEFVERLDRGEQPTVDEYVARHPELEAVLRDVLAALQLMRVSDGASSVAEERTAAAFVTEQLEDFRILREVGRGGMGVVYLAEQLSLNRRVALKVLPFAAALDERHLKRFKNEAQAAALLQHQNIVPVYAVGCERGVHYYAMQFIEGRTLAELIGHVQKDKPIPSTQVVGPDEPAERLAGSDSSRSRAAETQRHLETGNGISGSSGTPEYYRTVARLGIQAAEALEHAHQLGVVHRDVKPSNLMVDARGNLWITDFGLAQVQSGTKLTFTGDFVGTLRYASPEQSQVTHEAVDHRTDVYSLGITLYEMLTLKPAFDGRSKQELLRQIAIADPKPPRRWSPSIPAELETIVLKAIAKLPSERYATAQDFADDLRRHLDNRPIFARRPSWWQHVKKWVRRHQALSWSTVISLLTILGVTVGVLSASHRDIAKALAEKTSALGRETEANDKLKEEQARTKLALTQHTIALADREWWLKHPNKADQLLDSVPSQLRRWEWHYLKRRCHRELLTLSDHEVIPCPPTYLPDGKRMVVVDRSDKPGWQRVRIWDLENGKEVHRCKTPWVRRNVVLSSSDKPRVALLEPSEQNKGKFSILKVIDVMTCRELLNVPHPLAANRKAGRPVTLAISRDGRFVAVGYEDGQVRTFDVDKQKEQCSWPGTPQPGAGPRNRQTFAGEVMRLKYSPNGNHLVGKTTMDVARVWDLRTGKVSATFPLDVRLVRDLAMSPDGNRVAALAADRVTIVDWRAPNRALRIWMSTEADPDQSIAGSGTVTFSADGSLVAATGLDAVIRIWRASDGQLDRVVRTGIDGVSPGALRSVAFSPNGEQIASAADRGSVKLWDVTQTQERTTRAWTRPVKKGFSQIDVSPHGRNYAGLSGKSLLMWPASGRPTIEAPLNGDVPLLMEHSPNGTSLVVVVRRKIPGGWGEGIRVVDAATAKETGVSKFRLTRLNRLAFSPDGKHVASFARGGTIVVYETATAREIGVLQCATVAYCALGPGGRLLACFEKQGDAIGAKVIDVGSRSVVSALPTTLGQSRHGAFSPSGEHLAVSESDGNVTLYDPMSGKVVLTLDGGHRRAELAFHPDGTRLATAGNDQSVIIWDLQTGRNLLSLRLPDVARRVKLNFAGESGAQLIASYVGELTIWEAFPWVAPPALK